MNVLRRAIMAERRSPQCSGGTSLGSKVETDRQAYVQRKEKRAADEPRRVSKESRENNNKNL
jgi:ribosomal protein L4